MSDTEITETPLEWLGETALSLTDHGARVARVSVHLRMGDRLLSATVDFAPSEKAVPAQAEAA